MVPLNPRITDDRFVMVLDEVDASFDFRSVKSLLEEFDVVEIDLHVAEKGEIG